ncbi:hypothetical protein QAD02_002321 [Eretmocerus hayati]|uniref:Uncharacterized protein n=1 Tax=Eretmocerus hayati TaxID=131215 RepID=A0ACC2NIY5_9HYME|nr:hypothetical protein QAD02_002321 [Eretmocerus hayati]
MSSENPVQEVINTEMESEEVMDLSIPQNETSSSNIQSIQIDTQNTKKKMNSPTQNTEPVASSSQESIQHEKKAARKRRRMELKDLSENYDLLLRSDDEIEQSFTPPEPILPSGQVLIMKPDIQEVKSVERYFELCKKEYILRINTAGDEGEPFSITISSDRKMIRLSNNQWLEIIVIYQTMISEIKKLDGDFSRDGEATALLRTLVMYTYIIPYHKLELNERDCWREERMSSVKRMRDVYLYFERDCWRKDSEISAACERQAEETNSSHIQKKGYANITGRLSEPTLHTFKRKAHQQRW